MKPADVAGIQATVTADGPRHLLRALRKRVAESLRDEAPDTEVREQHGESRLTFHLQAAAGLPFPQLAAASAAYPECVLTVEWEQDGAHGSTTLREGRAEDLHQQQAPAGPPCLVRVDAQGGLAYAIVIDDHNGGDGHGDSHSRPQGRTAAGAAPCDYRGYCVTGGAETYFRISGTPATPVLYTIGGAEPAWDEQWRIDKGSATCRPLAPPQPLAAAERARLENLAAEFRAAWLWFEHQPLEETIIERQRFGQAARGIAAINVKSRRLDALRDTGEFSSLQPHSGWIAELLVATWIGATPP